MPKLRQILCSVAILALGGSLLSPGAPAQAAPKASPGQWFIESYGIDKAWESTTGKGVKVSIIDSGVKGDHENLTGKVVGAKDFSGSNTDGQTPVGPKGTVRHGTAVAGVIAGNGSNLGPRGVAPDAELLSASMWLGPGGPTDAPSSREQAADAIKWSVDKGAKVINMSLGWADPAWPEQWDEAFAYAYKKDVVIVACVGNASQGATRAWSPATVPGVVGVGGLKKDNSLDSESTAPGIAVDLMGPAQKIPVPYYEGGYAEAEGCSFAAPFVSGVAALIRSKHPDYSADQVVDVMTSTAKSVKGHDQKKPVDPIVGHGRIDPVAALEARPGEKVASAKDELAEWVRMHRRAQQSSKAGQDAIVDSTDKPGTTSAHQPTPHDRNELPWFYVPLLGVGGALIVAGAVAWQVQNRRRKNGTEKT